MKSQLESEPLRPSQYAGTARVIKNLAAGNTTWAAAVAIHTPAQSKAHLCAEAASILSMWHDLAEKASRAADKDQAKTGRILMGRIETAIRSNQETLYRHQTTPPGRYYF